MVSSLALDQKYFMLAKVEVRPKVPPLVFFLLYLTFPQFFSIELPPFDF